MTHFLTRICAKAMILLCVSAAFSTVGRASDFDNPNAIYRLVNVTYSKAVSNLNETGNDAPVKLTDVDADSQGQDWEIRLLDANQGIYGFRNPHCNKGIDYAAMHITYPYRLLQWEWGPDNNNQRYKIQTVNAQEGIYRITDVSGYRVMTAHNDGTIWMGTNPDAEGTTFYITDTRKGSTVTPVLGLTFLFKNKLTGGMLSNGGNKTSNAALNTEARDDSRYGQRWTLKATAKVQTFALFNDDAQMAVDACLNSTKTPIIYRT